MPPSPCDEIMVKEHLPEDGPHPVTEGSRIGGRHCEDKHHSDRERQGWPKEGGLCKGQGVSRLTFSSDHRFHIVKEKVGGDFFQVLHVLGCGLVEHTEEKAGEA